MRTPLYFNEFVFDFLTMKFVEKTFSTKIDYYFIFAHVQNVWKLNLLQYISYFYGLKVWIMIISFEIRQGRSQGGAGGAAGFLVNSKNQPQKPPSRHQEL